MLRTQRNLGRQRWQLRDGVIAVALLAATASLTGAQSAPAPSTTGNSVGIPRRPNEPSIMNDLPDELEASMRERREDARKIERHKRMVDNANRLVEATRQFDSDIQGREMTAADEKRLDEIARLAHLVKEQMRGN